MSDTDFEISQMEVLEKISSKLDVHTEELQVIKKMIQQKDAKEETKKEIIPEKTSKKSKVITVVTTLGATLLGVIAEHFLKL